MRVLAIDQGTSATKALVLDDDGAVLATAVAPVTPAPVAGGGVEQDPEQLWDSVCRSGRQAIAAAGVTVQAVGLANQGETVLAWDRRTGDPLSPAISWQDRRAVTVCDELAGRGEALARTTGLPLDPYFAAPKMRWLRQNVTGAGVTTTTDSWLLHRMTGAFVSDATTASRTMLLDLDRRTWSEWACGQFGIPIGDLPEVVSCSQPIGHTDVFGASVVVSGLCVDQQAALVGQHCLTRGEAKCTYGTGAFLLANTGEEPLRSTSGLAASVAWQQGTRATYCIDGQVYAAGTAVAWLCRWGLLDRPDSLDRQGGSVPDSGGVTVVPALSGLGAPWWRPDALASVEGIGPSTEPAHVVRATVEGVAAQVALLARSVAHDLGGPLARLQADGGLTRSALLMQTQADLLQLPVEVAPSPDATAIGVGALARLGAGEGRDLADVLSPMAPGARFEPAISVAEAAERLGRFEVAVRRIPDRRVGPLP